MRIKCKNKLNSRRLLWPVCMMVVSACVRADAAGSALKSEFQSPPDAARPGVYWYFMNGNLDGEEMIKDLDSMKAAGLGNLIFLECKLKNVPRGPVKYLGEEWKELFTRAVRHAEKIGIDISLGTGPGWSGSGGPWVKPEQSMQHLVSSAVEVTGPGTFDARLPIPKQMKNWLHKHKSPFYEDVFLWAFPKSDPNLGEMTYKALYDRGPWGQRKPYLTLPAAGSAKGAGIPVENLIDLRGQLQPDGRLQWEIPPGEWTILRMGRRTTGAGSRPAPDGGHGFEHDKLDKAALEAHFEHYFSPIIKAVGPRAEEHGWRTIHLDSWEMGAQNWTPRLVREFKVRRGYDPTPYFITYTGRAVESVEQSERFLWDLRQTVNDLIVENYVGHLNALGDQLGFDYSNEPYAQTPTDNIHQGSVADVPMCEFWTTLNKPNAQGSSPTAYISTSIAHIMGRPIVAAEAFTGIDQWHEYPGRAKAQGDWAFCFGINRFVYHTFVHKALGEEHRPGMTFGPYGSHWDRGQTWWPMVADYHEYITRCSHMLRQGVTVSDVLYLTAEGAPNVFEPPVSALSDGIGAMSDKKGYGFDGCSPAILIQRARVEEGMIAFPGGSSYRLLVLPRTDRMTPELLEKLIELAEAGATIYGRPPVASPSLTNYPECDAEVKRLAARLWGDSPKAVNRVGRGVVILDRAPDRSGEQFPDYAATASILGDKGVPPDFQPDGSVRYGHRRTAEKDIYFVANKSGEDLTTDCRFRVEGLPELWDPLTGEIRPLPDYTMQDGVTTIPMKFAPHQSFFVVFKRDAPETEVDGKNFPEIVPSATLEGEWEVSFDPTWGGPEKIIFPALQDWTKHQERGVRFYSGIATYKKQFSYAPAAAGSQPSGKIYLNLGTVHDMARVRLNGKDLGVVWCAPWRVEITDTVQEGGNQLEIEVANRWPNRLRGDFTKPDRNVRTVQFEEGFLGGQAYSTGRYTFSTLNTKLKGSGLLPSGLIGPVALEEEVIQGPE